MKRTILVLALLAACATVGPPVRKAADAVVQCGGSAIQNSIGAVIPVIAQAMSSGNWWAALQDILVRVGAGTFYCALDKYKQGEEQRPVMAALATGEATNSDKVQAFMDAHHVRVPR